MTAAVTRPRLAAIDALRGFAAMVVVVQHCAEELWVGYARWSVEVFRPGEFGVFVFFMVSGFVIPLSIERERDPISFWIGRFFRLFPLYWLLVTVGVVLWATIDYQVPVEIRDRPARNAVLNYTMVQNFLGSHDVLGPAWSLAYELVFYLFVTVLIVAGLTHTAVRSTLVVLGLACSAGVLIGPQYLLNAEPREKGILVAVGVAVAILGALWPRLHDRRSQIIGTITVVAIVGLVLNQHLDLWFSLFLFATIGCGWAYHEAHKERVAGWVPVALSATTLALAGFQLHLWVLPSTGLYGAQITWRADALTLTGAHVLFGLVYLVRHRQGPRILRFLGQISYSLYLVHALVLGVWLPAPELGLVQFAGWIAVSVVLSYLTYRLVELPGQRVGQHLRARWRDAHPPMEPGAGPGHQTTIGGGAAGTVRTPV